MSIYIVYLTDSHVTYTIVSRTWNVTRDTHMCKLLSNILPSKNITLPIYAT